MLRKKWVQVARRLKESGGGTGDRRTGETGPGAWTYAVAIGAVLVALALTCYAQSLVEGNLMLLCLAAVTVSAWYGGTGPGLVATLLAIVGTDYLFHPAISTARGSFAILTERLRPGLFAAVSIL